jgi:hypothetical protein
VYHFAPERGGGFPGLYGTSFLARLSSYREEDGHTIVMHQRW